MAEPLDDPEDKMAWLRAHGVEIETAEEREAKRRAAAGAAPAVDASGPAFSYVRIPADPTVPVEARRGHVAGGGAAKDSLPELLAPLFSDDGALDGDVVARETAERLKGMVVGGGAPNASLAAPSAEALAREARGGVCEAWPLSQPCDANGQRAVRFYIDEVGALRGRPRNARAEALALAVGLAGVSIHGDAYAGRCERLDGGGERSVDFGVAELAHDSQWVLDARQDHQRMFAQSGGPAADALPSGDGGGGGAYSWSQGEEDVEVRVLKGVPVDNKKRIGVSYGRGESLVVKVDGNVLLEAPKLFARVTPDECTWTVEKGSGTLVISLEKGEARPWATLTLPGSEVVLPIDGAAAPTSAGLHL